MQSGNSRDFSAKVAARVTQTLCSAGKSLMRRVISVALSAGLSTFSIEIASNYVVESVYFRAGLNGR